MRWQILSVSTSIEESLMSMVLPLNFEFHRERVWSWLTEFPNSRAYMRGAEKSFLSFTYLSISAVPKSTSILWPYRTRWSIIFELVRKIAWRCCETVVSTLISRGGINDIDIMNGGEKENEVGKTVGIICDTSWVVDKL